MSSNVVLGYSPNDFFYNSVSKMPDSDACNTILETDITPTCTQTGMADITTAQNCINYALCQNKQLATNIIDNQNVQDGSDAKFADTKIMYDTTFMDVINLGIGIIFAIAIIYKNRNMS
jgi:hypothetical protein